MIVHMFHCYYNHINFIRQANLLKLFINKLAYANSFHINHVLIGLPILKIGK